MPRTAHKYSVEKKLRPTGRARDIIVFGQSAKTRKKLLH